jgi:C1A family cysteine protease
MKTRRSSSPISNEFIYFLVTLYHDIDSWIKYRKKTFTDSTWTAEDHTPSITSSTFHALTFTNREIVRLMVLLCTINVQKSDTSVCDGLLLREHPSDKQNSEYAYDDHDVDIKPLSTMRVDKETLDTWIKDYNKAEETYIDPSLNQEIQTTSFYSILDHLNYIPSERSQGWCSNCWAWPATAILSIELFNQIGIFERLSVQYINSCGEEINVFPRIKCCEGANLWMFASFYKQTKIAIPWSNTNANWQDDHAECITTCDSISKTPSYPIENINAETLAKHGTPTSEVIYKIKNLLHQEQGVYFTIFYPDLPVLNDFRDMWRNYDEEYIYKLDQFCGTPWNNDEAAGHAVLIVGYNDPNPDIDDDDDYWIILNSWGTTEYRPHGLFLVDMYMNYDCQYSGQYAFNVETLNVTYKKDAGAPGPPEIDGPQSGLTNTPHTYKLSAVDPQNDDVSFTVDWDDGKVEEGLGPVASGEQLMINHSWNKKGSYTIRVQAKDTHGNESYWTTLPVTMPKNKGIMPIDLFLRKCPLLYWLVNRLAFA